MIQIGTTLTVYTGDNYNYEVTVDPDSMLSVTYIDETCRQRVEITFGSTDEMKAVAEAMLRALSLS